jgi:L-Ala-D/L-Glu epimerase
MLVRLTELAFWHVRIPLKKEIKHASHARSDTDSLVVRATFADGCQGWGEGLPRPYVTGESIDQAWDMIDAIDWRQQLGGDWSALNEAVPRLADWVFPRANLNDRDCFGNSVRCAVEVALLDGLCRGANVPLSHVATLLPTTTGIRQAQPRVRYGGAFTAMTPWSQIVRALKLRLFGFHQAKVKVGVAGVNDRTMLRRIRAMVGSEFDLRVDANEAWQPGQLEDRIARLMPYRISSVEQPVPHAQVHELARFRGRVGVPLMLDESLCSAVDARRAIELGTCDLFNLRLSKCGGLLPTWQLAGLAHRHGLGYQLGCQVGETGILSAAGRHWATSIADIRYLEGSYDRFLVAERLTVEDLTFGYGGWAPALSGPGLGISIDRQALQRVTIRHKTSALESV